MAVNDLNVNLRISKYAFLRKANVMGATCRHVCCVLARDPRKENHEASKSMGCHKLSFERKIHFACFEIGFKKHTSERVFIFVYVTLSK